MTKPVAVVINDVHYDINTLEVADAAMNMAIDLANELSVTLVVAGDLHNTKANIRGECINVMQKTFARAQTAVFILRGNHDAINEKSKEHSLNFLATFADIITEPTKLSDIQSMFGDPGILIPYHHDANELRAYLKTVPKGSRLIMHQGITGSKSGHYIQDNSALNPEDVADFRVISGHYHQRQDIKTGRPRKGAAGLWTYTGNPYTLGFGEANDGPKGIHILHEDGTLTFVPTNLREHVKLEYTYEELKGEAIFLGEDTDIVWVKITGTKEQLAKLTKKQVAIDLDINQDFKLELVPLESKAEVETKTNQTQPELLDNLISTLTNVTEEQKNRLKAIWKDLAE